MEITTYKKTNSSTPVFGEESPSVLKLQQDLISKGAQIKADAKYGPLTEAAVKQYGQTQTNTEEALDLGNDKKRFKRTLNANEKAIETTERKIRKVTLEEPDLASITKEKRLGAQAIIDSITAQFQKTLADQGIENASMNDRVRALNINSGLGGSDFATGAAAGQEKKNKQALDLIEAERNAKINEILTGVDTRASEEYRKRREEYVKGLGDDLTRLKQAKDEDRTKAKETISGLAAQGVTLDKLKQVDSKSYETLLEEYGGSPLELETAWNSLLPDDKKIKYEQEVIRGSNGNAVVLRYGVNPQNNKIDRKEYDLGMDYDSFKDTKPIEADGVLYKRNPDGSLTPLTTKTPSDSDGFKFTNTQRSKLIASNFNDKKISAIEADLKKYGVQAVLDGLSTDEEKSAIKESLKGSSLADQLAEFVKNESK